MTSKKDTLSYIENLYVQYAAELRELTQKTKPLYDRFIKNGWGATYSDIEAETLYLLLRDQKPEVVFEISPDCGYSTHYILQALTKNQKGKLYSFELSRTIRNIPTEEAIRSVQLPDSDVSRLNLVVGDVRVKLPEVKETPDFIFLDSCHDDFFAEWYVKFLFPRCKGLALIHDIMYPGGVPELSSESTYLQTQANNVDAELACVGDLELSFFEKRACLGLTERRPYFSISALISDCSKFKAGAQLQNEGVFVDFIKNARHTQSIQDVQVSPWKNANESVGEQKASEQKAAPLSLSNNQIQSLLKIAPITLAHELAALNETESSTLSLLPQIQDLYSRKKFAELLKVSSALQVSTQEVHWNNAIEILIYLQTNSNHSEHLAQIKQFNLSSQAPTYWKLRIIDILKVSQSKKIEFIQDIQTQIIESTIYNKRLALEILGFSAEGIRLFKEIVPSLFDHAARNQISYRHLKKIFNSFAPTMSADLKTQFESTIGQIILGRRKATLEMAMDYLFTFKPVKALSLFQNGKEKTTRLDDMRFIKHQFKARLKEAVKGYRSKTSI